MSEGSARGGTAPLGHAIVGPAGEANAAANAAEANATLDPRATQGAPPGALDPRATQVTASAVPSTLESPKALGGGAAPTAMSPQRSDLAGGPAPSAPGGAATALTPPLSPAPPLAAPQIAPSFGGGLALTIDDVDGAELNDAAMREVARREAAAAPQIERHPVGPPTLVSPGGAGAPFPYPPAPPQVPPHYPESRDASARHGAFAPQGAHGAGPMAPLRGYDARPARRPMSGLVVALIICGLVVVIGGGAILAVTFLVVASERAEATRAAREARTSAPMETAAPPAPPTLPPPIATPPVSPTPPVVAPGAGARPTPSAHRTPPR